MYVRNESRDEEGETRAERNARFGVFVEIEEPEPPDAVAHVWAWFWEWSSSRKSATETLGWTDLEAWRTMTGALIDEEECRLMILMDRAYVNAVIESQKAFKERSEAIKKATGKA